MFVNLSIGIPKTDSKKALDVTGKIAAELGALRVDMRDDISKVSVVGVGMRTHSGVAARMFQTLAGHSRLVCLPQRASRASHGAHVGRTGVQPGSTARELSICDAGSSVSSQRVALFGRVNIQPCP
ncbi:MAG: hypothetical protein P8Y85_08570, partial [Nitrospirota bacterium]